ncbi:MAG TPA: hypothetical protein VGC76_11760 [Pyrinomonadaceae bacterium]|jgi:hypothetical protein
MAVSFFLLFGATLFYLFCVDRLIRFEYKNYKDEWIKDGKPYGYYWTSRESTFWQGCSSREACSKKWLEEKPDWIQQDPKAIDLLNRLHRSKWFMYFSLSIWGALFLVFLLFERAGVK